MKTRNDLWILRQTQQAQPRVLIRMPTPQNIKSKEQHNEKATPKQTDAPSDMRDELRTDFAIQPVFPKPDAERRPTQPDPVEMEAIRAEALIYTRLFGGEERRDQ